MRATEGGMDLLLFLHPYHAPETAAMLRVGPNKPWAGAIYHGIANLSRSATSKVKKLGHRSFLEH
jgi:hypothetical protein